ncbi:MAG: hypothetical protein VX829_01995 [Pseudomonadota bacterium]|nr:hypothetical protein [Pseudomonadota bacterium]
MENVKFIKREFIDESNLETLDQFDRNDQRGTTPFYIIEIDDNRISVIGNSSTSIKAIKRYLSPEIFKGFKNTVFAIASSGEASATTLVGSYIRSFSRFVETEKISSINIENLSKFHEHCRKNSGTKFLFNAVRSFLMKWHKHGYYGINDQVADFINEFWFSEAKRSRGKRVRSDNPEEGWYTDQEYDDLVWTIWNDYESNKVELQRTLMLLLGAQYGRRPIQLAHLKIGDIKKDGENCGVSGKRIEFPGAKEKDGARFRESKQEIHPIGNDLWRLCQLQMRQAQAVWEEGFGSKLSSKNVCELPLFYSMRKSQRKKNIKLALDYSPKSDSIYASEYLHLRSDSVSNYLRRRDRNYDYGTPVISLRTGRPLVENAYRFRYTRARQLARMGVPRSSLQYWMGHESPASLDAYYDDPAERARTLDEALSPLLAPLAQAFQGILIDSEEGAERANDPSSRIQLDGKEELAVGSCGEHGFCSASVPIPCYRCSNFQPWVYGPHDEVLDRLLERQRIENEVPLVGQSKRLLLPVQLDKDINAVRVVISLCDERKKVLEKANE